MNDALAERYIEQRLLANWSTTPIDINPNVNFVPPASAYIKLNVFNERTIRKTIGVIRPVYRHLGTIIIRVFTPLHTGTRTGKTLGEGVAAIFNEQSFDCIVCRQSRVSVIGEFEGRLQTNVITPFIFDSDCTV